jgi:hypothetical protein
VVPHIPSSVRETISRALLSTLRKMSLLTDLDAFSTEHGRCGDLDAGVDDVMVWIACDCGASIARRVDEEDDHAEPD